MSIRLSFWPIPSSDRVKAISNPFYLSIVVICLSPLARCVPSRINDHELLPKGFYENFEDHEMARVIS